MSVTIPTSFDLDLTLGGGTIGAVGPVTVSGIPDSFAISSLPKIQVGLDTIDFGAITLNPLTLNPITVNPGPLNVALTQIPNVRAHLPSTYCVGLCLFGIEVFAIRLCGESQIITEPYVPNPCERCVPLPAPAPVEVAENPPGASQDPQAKI